MRNLLTPLHNDAEAANEYRLLCSCCSRIPLELNHEQIDLLRDQMGFTYRQAELAASLIEQNQVPRWYAWRGFPEDHELRAAVSANPPSHGSPEVDCDCEEERCRESVEIEKQHIVSIPLTEEQRAAIRDKTGGASFALECSAEVLETCVNTASQEANAGAYY